MSGKRWKKPAIPTGPLRDLNEALHELHARSGYLSSRRTAAAVYEKSGHLTVSHTTLRKALTEPGMPNQEHVIAIVDAFLDRARTTDKEREIDRFEELLAAAAQTKSKKNDPDTLVAAVAEIDELRRTHWDMGNQLRNAQKAYLRKAASALVSGHIDWRALDDCYTQLQRWFVPNISHFWSSHIPHRVSEVRRNARKIPPCPDGTWKGSGGKANLYSTEVPPNGLNVVFMLLDEAGKVLNVGMTHAFARHIGSKDKSGFEWSSWIAWPCDTRLEAKELRAQKRSEHGLAGGFDSSFTATR